MKTFDGCAGVDDLKAVGFTSRDGQKTLSDTLMKSRTFSVEPGRGFAFGFTAPSGEPVLRFLDRKVKQQGEIRGKAVGGERNQRFDDGVVGLSAVALIGTGRIGEAVADDDAASFEDGTDERRDVLRSIGGEKKGLGAVGERFVSARVKQQAPNFDAHIRAAGFTGQNDIVTIGAQSFKKFDGLSRFPRAVNTFERDEKTA
jgi:hypothetical protein